MKKARDIFDVWWCWYGKAIFNSGLLHSECTQRSGAWCCMEPNVYKCVLYPSAQEFDSFINKYVRFPAFLSIRHCLSDRRGCFGINFVTKFCDTKNTSEEEKN